MLIAEDFLILTRSEDGRSTIGGGEVPVAGALLCELALAERISLESGRIAVIDDSATGDELLDEALTRFAARVGMKPRSVLAQVGTDLPAMVLERLRQAEILDQEPTRMLGLRLWTRWPVIDTARQEELRADLLDVLTGRVEPGPRTGSLVALLHATSALRSSIPPQVRQGIPMRDLNRRAKEIAQGRWAATAVREAIQASTAATAGAVAASAAATS